MNPSRIAAHTACLALAVALPWIFDSMLFRHYMIVIGINVIVVISLDMVVGHAGLTSLGHAGFMGVGAYTCALLVKDHHVPFFAGLAAAMVTSGALGALIGYPSLRLKGHYFVIVTFICGIIFTLLFTNLVALTKGPMGIPGIPPPTIGLGAAAVTFDSKLLFYYLVLAFVLGVMYVKTRCHDSKMGRALCAVKEDEDLARSLGIRAHFYKVTVFVLSTSLAGLAGGLYAHYMRFIGPDSFTFLHSFEFFVMNLVGGPGTLAGPIVGPLILTLIDELSQLFKPEAARILFGLFLIFVILYMPSGIIGLLKDQLQRRRPSEPWQQRF